MLRCTLLTCVIKIFVSEIRQTFAVSVLENVLTRAKKNAHECKFVAFLWIMSIDIALEKFLSCENVSFFGVCLPTWSRCCFLWPWSEVFTLKNLFFRFWTFSLKETLFSCKYQYQNFSLLKNHQPLPFMLPISHKHYNKFINSGQTLCICIIMRVFCVSNGSSTRTWRY